MRLECREGIAIQTAASFHTDELENSNGRYSEGFLEKGSSEDQRLYFVVAFAKLTDFRFVRHVIQK